MPQSALSAASEYREPLVSVAADRDVGGKHASRHPLPEGSCTGTPGMRRAASGVIMFVEGAFAARHGLYIGMED